MLMAWYFQFLVCVRNVKYKRLFKINFIEVKHLVLMFCLTPFLINCFRSLKYYVTNDIHAFCCYCFKATGWALLILVYFLHCFKTIQEWHWTWPLTLFMRQDIALYLFIKRLFLPYLLYHSSVISILFIYCVLLYLRVYCQTLDFKDSFLAHQVTKRISFVAHFFVTFCIVFSTLSSEFLIKQEKIISHLVYRLHPCANIASLSFVAINRESL